MPESTHIHSPGSTELIESTAKVVADMVLYLVHRPDRVTVDIQASASTITLHLGVDPDDLGKVIGKLGRTAQSLRTILNAISVRSGTRFELDIRAGRP